MCRTRARRVQEGSARAPRPVHQRLAQLLHVVGVVVIIAIRHEVDESRPTATDAKHTVAFAERTNSDRPNGRVEPGNVTATGENCDGAFGGHFGCAGCKTLAFGKRQGCSFPHEATKKTKPQSLSGF